MEASDAVASAPRKRSAGRRLADLFQGRPHLQAGTLLSGPLAWLVVGYLGSLAVLLVAAFWSVSADTGLVVQTYTLDNFKTLLDDSVYHTIAGRTIAIASLVTVTDVLLAFPIAFYMAKVARPRTRGLLLVGMLLPLWASYLVKVYAWRQMLSADGVINWALAPLGAHGPGYGNVAVWLVMSYLWLPYMILPVYAGLGRIPDSLLSASEDLGASPVTTFRRIVVPLTFPAVVAGSIFTFSLTLGDYITPTLVSNNQFIGNVIYSNIVTDRPLASAFACVPIAVMIIYLLIARRLGAFDHL
jgi:putative spermidine/putrescine transport system permease protein